MNIQLNYKGQKFIELKEISKENLVKANALHEKLLDNRERAMEIGQARQDLESGVNRANRDVTFLTGRELVKRYLIVGLILVLGVLDFIALIYRITRIFR